MTDTAEPVNLLGQLRASIEGLDSEREFELGEKPNVVHFRITKLKALPCFRLWETVRVAVGEMLQGGGVALPAGRQIISAILALPEPTVDHLRTELFKQVSFRTADVSGGYITLGGNEDMAFEHLEAAHIYAVLGRAISVNFLPTLSAALSRAGEEVIQATGQ